MRERRQIAAGADRTLAGHDGRDAGVDQGQQRFHHGRPNARVAARQAQHLQGHGQHDRLTSQVHMGEIRAGLGMAREEVGVEALRHDLARTAFAGR